MATITFSIVSRCAGDLMTIHCSGITCARSIFCHCRIGNGFEHYLIDRTNIIRSWLLMFVICSPRRLLWLLSKSGRSFCVGSVSSGHLALLEKRQLNTTSVQTGFHKSNNFRFSVVVWSSLQVFFDDWYIGFHFHCYSILVFFSSMFPSLASLRNS